MAEHGFTRVAITGIGVVSPYGVGREVFWRHVSRGCSATRGITEFDASAFAQYDDEAMIALMFGDTAA